MKFAILVLVAQFLLHSVASATLRSPNKQLTRESIIYNLSGPTPLNEIKVTFVLKGWRNIEELIVEINGEIYSINSQQLGIDYYPRLDNLAFTYKRLDEKYGILESAEFGIPYDRKNYIDCGNEGRISYFKEKKVIIHAYAPPDVIEETSTIEKCYRLEADDYPLPPIYGEEWNTPIAGTNSTHPKRS